MHRWIRIDENSDRIMSIDRRTFLRLGGIGIAGVTFAPLIAGCENHIVTPLGSDGGTLPEIPFLTPITDFYTQYGGEGDIVGWKLPTISKQDWTLAIRDPVFSSEPLLEVTYADVIAAADEGNEITLLKTMQCILESRLRLTQTGFTGTATWTGVPLKYFLDKAEVDYGFLESQPDNRGGFVINGADGFRNNLKVRRFTQAEQMGLPQPILATRMNGEDLPPEHGGPVRLVVQEDYGYKNIKWISEVRVGGNVKGIGNYQSNGFVDDATMRVTSRSTNLHEQITLPAGTITVSGFALSGSAGITAVEVAIDDGSYLAADLQSKDDAMAALPAGTDTVQFDSGAYQWPFLGVWRKWSHVFQSVQPGEHTVAIRATDGAGNVQAPSDDDISDGQTGVATYTITAV